MSSVVPTPEDIKRQQKLMRKLRVVEDVDPSTKHPSPREQKKIDKALRKIINETDAPGLGEPVH